MVQFTQCGFLTLFYSGTEYWNHSQWVTPFGNLRITGYVLLPAAFRSLSRPSSPRSSKASTIHLYSLDHIIVFSQIKSQIFRRWFKLAPAGNSGSHLVRQNERAACAPPFFCRPFDSRIVLQLYNRNFHFCVYVPFPMLCQRSIATGFLFRKNLRVSTCVPFTGPD